MANRDRATSPRILALWSAPRCRSTAFLRMMIERDDFHVLHEPFSYLAEFDATAIGDRVVTTGLAALDAIRALSHERPVFFKDTTDERYPDVLADEAFLGVDAVHAFLIRHPRFTVPSYHAVNPDVRCDQIGFGHLAELHAEVVKRSGTEPVVIDAEELVAAPEAVVRAFCEAVGIPWRAAAMAWSPGARPEWANTQRWHAEASSSGGFIAPPTGSSRLDDPRFAAMVAYHVPFYEDLYARRLRL